MKKYIRSDVGNKNSDFEIDASHPFLLRYKGKSKNVVVPDGIEWIGPYAFANNMNLQTIQFPDTLDSIGEGAFSGCKNLISIDIPDNVYHISFNCFRNCTKLTQVNLPIRIKKIPSNCFENCKSLTNINIPDSVIEIGDHAFSGCTNLKEVKNMPDIEISRSVFEGCKKLDTTNFRYASIPEESEENVRHNEYVDINDWYMSSDGEIDNDKFAEDLENLVRTEFDVGDYFEEPSIQGFAGADIISIKLKDGSEYSFSFSWSEMQEIIYSDGPEAAANYYFNEIKEGIESGSAIVEDTPTL